MEPIRMPDGRVMVTYTPRAPFTVYAVALVYFRQGGDKAVSVASWMFQVSGEAPLSLEEAAVRAWREYEAVWPEGKNGPLARWRRGPSAVSFNVVTAVET